MKIDFGKLVLYRQLIGSEEESKNLNIFSERKLVKNWLEESNEVLDGEDFETGMIFALKDEFDYIDPYTKLKLGKKEHATQSMKEYSERVLKCIEREKIHRLLYLCRLCSYLGGPGFPDFIAIDKKDKLFLVLVQESLLTEHIFFILVAKLYGIDIRLINLKKAGREERAEIDIKEFFEQEVKKERFNKYSEKLEMYVNTVRVQDIMNKEDEIEFMRESAYRMPFFLIKKWSRDLVIDKEDFEASYQAFLRTLSSMNILVKNIKDHIENDPSYTKISEEKEDKMKKRFEYILTKFGIGESRAKEIMSQI